MILIVKYSQVVHDLWIGKGQKSPEG